MNRYPIIIWYVRFVHVGEYRNNTVLIYMPNSANETSTPQLRGGMLPHPVAASILLLSVSYDYVCFPYSFL